MASLPYPRSYQTIFPQKPQNLTQPNHLWASVKSVGGSFSYEKVREALVIINRMTGYDEEDIYEYLENSFESLLWDWGYFALLAGF